MTARLIFLRQVYFKNQHLSFNIFWIPRFCLFLISNREFNGHVPIFGATLKHWPLTNGVEQVVFLLESLIWIKSSIYRLTQIWIYIILTVNLGVLDDAGEVCLQIGVSFLCHYLGDIGMHLCSIYFHQILIRLFRLHSLIRYHFI